MTPDQRAAPYVGLRPFSFKDGKYFFGRTREQRIITSNLRGARLTVLYAPSGIGKSSLLEAGVVYTSREKTPKLPIVYFKDWQGADFLLALKRACIEEAKRILPAVKVDSNAPPRLDGLLGSLSDQLGVAFYLILDQFEEYTQYHPEGSAAATQFESELADAIHDEELDGGFLLSLREDALSELDRFKLRLPEILGNTLRLEPMTEETARDAIRKPLERYEQETGKKIKVSDALVDTVIAAARQDPGRGAQRVSAPGEGAEEGGGASRSYVEAASLQLVMDRVWKADIRDGKAELRARTLPEVKQIIERYFDDVMGRLGWSEKKACVQMFHLLVPTSGRKHVYATEALVKVANRPEREIQGLLQKLERERVVRHVVEPEGYELMHDALSPAVRKWLAQREQDARELRTVRNMGLGVVILLMALLGWGFKKSLEVTGQQAAAASSVRRSLAWISALKFQAAARDVVSSDFTLALKYAVRAVEVLEKEGAPADAKQSTEAQDVLRDLLSIRPFNTSVAGSMSWLFDRTGRRVAGVGEREINLFDVASGAYERQLALPSQATVFPCFVGAFDREGRRLGMVSSDGQVLSWDLLKDEKVSQAQRGPKLADFRWGSCEGSFSGDLRRFAALAPDDTVAVWDLQTGKQLWSRKYRDSPSAIQLSPDGQLIAIARSRAIEIRSFKDNKDPVRFVGNGSSAKWLAFSPDGQTLGAVGNWQAQVFKLATKTTDSKSFTLPAHGRAFFASSLSKLLVINNDDTSFTIWDVDSRAPVRGSRKSLAQVSHASPGLDVLLVELPGNEKALYAVEATFEDPLKIARSRVPSADFTAVQYASVFGAFVPRLGPGIDDAKAGKLEEAVAAFEEANLFPGISIDARREARRLGALHQLDQARQAALDGDVDKTQEALKRAKGAEPALQVKPAGASADRRLDPDAILALAYAQKAAQLSADGNYKDAVPLLKDAHQLDQETVTSSLLNRYCWRGSLANHAADVLTLCDLAVKSEADNADFRDSRGLARALAGDKRGAAEDFSYFVQKSSQLDASLASQRRRWISDLQANQNPFTPNVVQALRVQ